MLEGSAEEAHQFGESTFMIYTGALKIQEEKI